MENIEEVSQEQNQNIKAKSGFRQSWREMSLLQKGVTIALTIIVLFLFYVVLDANKYRATVHVIEGQGAVGVNPTDQALDFGDLSLGTTAVRKVTIENGTAMPMYIAMFKIGKISELMKIDNNFFKLPPRDTAEIEYTVFMPASAVVDSTYNGRVYLFKVPTFGL